MKRRGRIAIIKWPGTTAVRDKEKAGEEDR